VSIPAKLPDPFAVPLSAWAKRVLITKRRDPAFFLTVEENEEGIKMLLKKPIDTTERLRGVIYALRHDEIDLVKLGQTTTTAESRRGKIQSCRRLGRKHRIIVGANDLPLPELLRLEQFVQVYFRPHRVFFECLHADDKTVTHQECFDVPDDVVREVISFARELWTLNIYEAKPRSPDDDWFELKKEFVSRLEALSAPRLGEDVGDHYRKLERWKKMLQPVPRYGLRDTSCRSFWQRLYSQERN
jgi:hypothetical protein